MRARTWLSVLWHVLVCTLLAAAARELRVLQPDARATFFVGIAAPPSAAEAVRAFNRTLADLSKTYYIAGNSDTDSPLHLRNITLQPLYVELPEDGQTANELTVHLVLGDFRRPWTPDTLEEFQDGKRADGLLGVRWLLPSIWIPDFLNDYPVFGLIELHVYGRIWDIIRFSARVLEQTCSVLEGRRVAALLVCGGGPAATAAVTAANRAGVPVLRSSPTHVHLPYTIANELLPLEIRLEITARETLHALRATLLHTHWHTFILLVEEDIYSTISLRKDLSSILTAPPLNPKWLLLPPKYSRRALFRSLAEISRLTRGVVVLICDIHYTKLVMDEAKRLNMLDGHFFWLWIDSTSEIDIFRKFNNQHTRNKFNEDGSKAPTNPNIRFSRSVHVESIDIDNNNINLEKTLHEKEKSDISLNEITAKNRSNNPFFQNKKVNFKVETHITSKRILDFNDNQYVIGSKISEFSSSSENVRNYHVNNKGVETSKLNKNSIMDDKSLLSLKEYDRFSRFSRRENESFNKYVHSITIDSIDNEKTMSLEELNIYKNKLDRSNILSSSDTRIFLTNPTVRRRSTMNKLRDKVVKREDNYMKEKSSEKYLNDENITVIFNSLPLGLLALHPQPMKSDRYFVEAAVRLTIDALKTVLRACDAWSAQAQFFSDATASCWEEPSDAAADFSMEYVRETRKSTSDALAGGSEYPESLLTASFALLNLVPGINGENDWHQVGEIKGRDVNLHTIVWPGGRLVAHGQSAGARTVFRIVTALAPPFVMEGELDEDGQCLRGLPCHRPQTSDKDNLTLAFNELEKEIDQESGNYFFPTTQVPPISKMATHCCYGLAMDLLENIAVELEFDFHLYLVEDGLYGSRKLVRPFKKIREYKDVNTEFFANEHLYRSQYRHGFIYSEDDSDQITEDDHKDEVEWNGIIGDLVSGAAHMSFAALSVTSARAEVIEYSQPYFFSRVSVLAAPNQRADVPLLAFLLPFSPELWVAIFTSLNVTAIAVAIYEWLSPFGLNPWGRQRSKNFSIASALWVMWGLLCGHLVAFKAPKSWPNKFLINVWGGFSVIFVASYTANIAALIAGLFFHNSVDDYHGRSNWLSLRVGTPRSSASEYYIQRNNPQLAQQIRKFTLQDIEDGIDRLRNGSLDLLIADTPILDYYRATDDGCKLQRVGDHALAEDTYAIGMSKGFPLKDSISAVIAKYSSNGYMDILTEKWYGGLPCFKLSPDYGIQPQPLGVAAVAGVFILLGLGMVVGCLILIFEHLFYRYTLPVLRHQPKGTIWRSRNIMFFSQKLYRFINCVELVSPHHAARELVNTIRQGHFTSLFQKSVKRKEHEQRRRRKSKAQFFEMIQEIRRVQQGRDRSLDSIKENVVEAPAISGKLSEPKYLSASSEVLSRSPRQGRSPRQNRSPKQIITPKGRRKRCSLTGLNVRRFSTDSVLESDSSSLYERTSLSIGRRLSRDIRADSPPDISTRLRTPSPMIRRAEGSSTRSNQDVSERFKEKHSHNDSSIPKPSVEILVSEENDLPVTPSCPRMPPAGSNFQLSEDELLRLWRSSEREVRESLLAALQERRANLDPKRDPG